MREPQRHELNNTYIVVLTNEELLILKSFHEQKIKPIKEKLDKLHDKYMDMVKSDFYHQKNDELASIYYYHKNSLDLINNLIK